jgi:hypothetical protein
MVPLGEGRAMRPVRRAASIGRGSAKLSILVGFLVSVSWVGGSLARLRYFRPPTAFLARLATAKSV